MGPSKEEPVLRVPKKVLKWASTYYAFTPGKGEDHDLHNFRWDERGVTSEKVLPVASTNVYIYCPVHTFEGVDGNNHFAAAGGGHWTDGVMATTP